MLPHSLASSQLSVSYCVLEDEASCGYHTSTLLSAYCLYISAYLLLSTGLCVISTYVTPNKAHTECSSLAIPLNFIHVQV